MRKRVTNWPILVLLSVFALLTLSYSINVPIFEASDELWHYPMVEYIARMWQLPVQPTEPGQSSGPWRQEASQPPLYYGIGAILTSGIDTSDMAQVRHINPHAAAGEVTSDRNNVNLIVHNPAVERFPWTGTTLAVHIVRFFSVALGVWSVYLTWLLVGELYPKSPNIAWLAAAIQAFTPMYMFITASVNNDNLVIPLSTLAVLMMTRHVKSRAPMLRASEASSVHHALVDYLLLGLVIALAILTKYGAIVLLPLAAATAAWDTWATVAPLWYAKKKLPRYTPWYFFVRVLVVIVPTAVITGWWFFRNFRLYGDWLGLNAFYAVLGTRDVPATLAQLWSERFSFMAGYWGNFGGLNVPMPDFVYHILNSLAIFAMLSVIVTFILWLIGRHSKATPVASRINPFQWDPLTAARALSWAWAVAVLVSWSRWATITWSSQGRLIFSSLPMWSLGLAIGLSAFLPEKRKVLRVIPAYIFVAGLLSLCVMALPVWIAPAYDPRFTSVMASEEPILREEIKFGNTLQLKGYRLVDKQTYPGGRLSLEVEWEALEATSTDHSLFIHVLGQGERIIVQRDSFPNRGLVSTTQLQPGDSWRERYDFYLPRLSYAPDNLTFAFGLYETASGERQMLYDIQGTPLGTKIALGSVPLTQPDSAVPLGVMFDGSIRLDAYDVSALIVSPGDPLDVSLDWACKKAMDTDYTFSLQLIDSQWNKVAQSDSWPVNGGAPTTSWVPGQSYKETRTLSVSPDAPAAEYDLMLTIYYQLEDGTFAHLPIVWQSGQMPLERVKLTSIRVE